MRTLLLLKNIWVHIKELLTAPVLLTRFQKKHPTCRFYPGAKVDEVSSLGQYNVIFRNTSIVNSTVGDHTFIQHDSQVNHADIGKFCSIAPGVVIGLGRHPVDYVSTHPAFYSVSQPIAKSYADRDHFEPFERTTIGHDVWLGQNALITDGVTIGDGAVVAAGSVVTKDVPAYAIVGGMPAKIIRYRFDEDKRIQLLRTEWWNMPEEWFQENFKIFCSIEVFLNLIKK
jgi:acetyltransferase-like isoleucine patch superfamily enzyme